MGLMTLWEEEDGVAGSVVAACGCSVSWGGARNSGWFPNGGGLSSTNVIAVQQALESSSWCGVKVLPRCQVDGELVAWALLKALQQEGWCNGVLH